MWNTLDRRLSRAARYGYPADIFSAGVAFAELLLGVSHFFRGGAMGPQYDLLRDRIAALHRRVAARPACFATVLPAPGLPLAVTGRIGTPQKARRN